MSTKKKQEYKVTIEQAELYDTISPLLTSAFREIKDLSKKNPNDALNLQKIKIINRLLISAKVILENEPCIEYLEELEEDDIPTTSDAVLILSQYVSALDDFHSRHYSYENNWNIPGNWD